MDTKPLKGMLDLAPDEGDIWLKVLDDALSIIKSYGYNFVRTPVVERKELFVRSVGDTTDIVEKEMYEFSDRKGNILVLRPEETASIVRMCIEKNLFHGRSYLKLYTFGPMFRYERPQKGRQREFYQIDVEFIGIKDPYVEVESMLMIDEIIKVWGIKDFSYKVNHLGCSSDREAFKKELYSYLVSRKNKLCEDCVSRLNRNVLRVLDCKNESCRSVIKGAPSIMDFLCADCRNYLEEVVSTLDGFGISVELDNSLVRGLDYYTGFVFEITSGELGAQSAFIGGGRYDELIKDMGGPDVPAFGFGIGIDRAFLLVRKTRNIRPHIFLCPLDVESKRKLFEVKQGLIKHGIYVEGGYIVRSLKALLKMSHRANAMTSLIMGEDERAKNAVLIRDMDTGDQRVVPFSPNSILEVLRDWGKIM